MRVGKAVGMLDFTPLIRLRGKDFVEVIKAPNQLSLNASKGRISWMGLTQSGEGNWVISGIRDVITDL